jgi:hypothetical protein
MKKIIINADLAFMQTALQGKGINSKPKATHRITVSRRRKQIDAELKHIGEAMAADDDYKEYITELKELKDKYCDKTESGKPVEEEVGTGKEKVKIPVITKKLDTYMKAMQNLKKKHKVAIDKYDTINETYEESLLEVADVKLAPVVLADFVQEKTAFGELFGLFPLIDDFEDDKLLKTKVDITLTVREIMGRENVVGLFSPQTVTQLNSFINWDLNLILAFNLRSIRSHGFLIKKEKVYADYFDGYENKRNKLIIKHSKKNIDDMPIVSENSYVLEDASLFNKEMAVLEKESKGIIKAFDKFLDKEIIVKAVMIPDVLLTELDKLLEDDEFKISIQQSDILDYFVKI